MYGGDETIHVAQGKKGDYSEVIKSMLTGKTESNFMFYLPVFKDMCMFVNTNLPIVL